MSKPSRYNSTSHSTESLTGDGDAAEPVLRPPPMQNRANSKKEAVLDRAAVQTPKPKGNERIYEAFNDLHTLATVFDKPFDAPAILIVGQQTDGKSALVEALIGFQFNHVGGGTKTRRPIALHMKYNAACVQPHVRLVNEDMGEVEMSLEELRRHIEVENTHLEQGNQFYSKEIIVKVEYKYCPNLTIIDTPGLITAAPGTANAQLQSSSRAIEQMVRTKMEQKELIIVCLEDTNDWTNATTRRVVMQVDPTLSRTVVVATKFDTRLPTFSRASDVEMYLKPASLEPTMLGGTPFFTSVPAGRVGSDADAVFSTNEDFRIAIAEREAKDVAEIEAKMGRRLDRSTERTHIGVGRLRVFLEVLLQQRYLETVPTIVPLLDKEYRAAQSRLAGVRAELAYMTPARLKERGRVITEAFLTHLSLVLRGTAGAPADKFGETLADEHARGGAFTRADGAVISLPEGKLPNASMRLFGGAQFHRAMAEFRMAVGQMSCPDLSKEEVANACGLDDSHDGANYMRAACVIAVSKAREAFEPFIHQLGYRLTHVLRRLLQPTIHLMQREGSSSHLAGADAIPAGAAASGTASEALLRHVSEAFTAFIDEVEGSCKARCLEDLSSTTRYVSWSLHTKSERSLRSMLNKVKMPEQSSTGAEGAGGGGGADGGVVADLLEHTMFNRQLTVTNEDMVAALVAQIFEGIRDHVVQSMELKFNCFFLMPVVDAFPSRLRSQMEALYEAGLDETFDVAANRSVLEFKLKSLQSEVHQVERLQRKFSTIHSTLQQLQAATDGVGVPGNVQGSIKDKEASSLIAAAASGAQPLGVRTKGVGAVTATRDTGDAALMRDAGAAKAHVVAAPLRVAGAVAAAQAALVAGK